MDITKILIIRLSSAGDIVLTFPAYSHLRKSFPNAVIDWVVDARFSELLALLPGLGRVIEFPGKKLGGLSFGEKFERMKDFLRELRYEHYDIAIDFQGLFKSGIISFISRSPLRAAFAPGGHDSREFNHLFQNIRVNADEPFVEGLSKNISYRSTVLASKACRTNFEYAPPALSIPEADRGKANYFFEETAKNFEFSNVVILNPFTNWATKTWPAKHWAELVAMARKEKQFSKTLFVILWGPAEKKEAEWIAEHCDAGTVMAPATKLREVFAIIERADMAVSGDSFALHAAHMLGKKTVALFGASDPARCAPIGKNSRTVSMGLTCQHCFKKTCLHSSNACIENLDARDVLKNMLEFYWEKNNQYLFQE